MLLTEPIARAIADGSVTIVFRRWAKPRVKADGTFRAGVGVIRVTSIDEVAEITEADAAAVTTAVAALSVLMDGRSTTENHDREPRQRTTTERSDIMNDQKPVIALVHGAFAESASWNGVIERLQAKGLDAIAIGIPLRSLTIDATYVRDVVAGLGRPVVLVGHSYGGMVITEAASGNDAVKALVYVGAFAPDTGESALTLSSKFPGSTLGATLTAYPVSTGGNELAIRADAFHDQFCADVPAETAALMAATQRPVTEASLSEGLPTDAPAWKQLPSWFVYGDADMNIPAELQRFAAERAGSRGTRELPGVSHALSVSAPEEVAASVLDAVAAVPAPVG